MHNLYIFEKLIGAPHPDPLLRFWWPGGEIINVALNMNYKIRVLITKIYILVNASKNIL